MIIGCQILLFLLQLPTFPMILMCSSTYGSISSSQLLRFKLQKILRQLSLKVKLCGQMVQKQQFVIIIIRNTVARDSYVLANKFIQIKYTLPSCILLPIQKLCCTHVYPTRNSLSSPHYHGHNIACTVMNADHTIYVSVSVFLYIEAVCTRNGSQKKRQS